MPVYSFKCNNCGEKFDLLVGITQEKAKLVCKKCGSKNIEKQLSTFGINMESSSSSISSTSAGSCPTGTCPLG
jgi:putative FmdB family regulatory protein